MTITIADATAGQTCVVVGASHAGAQVVAQLRRAGWQGRIVMLGEEPHLPYHRPPLSKQFISAGDDAETLLLRPTAFYETHNIDVRLNVRAESLDAGQRQITLDSGEVVRYDRLVLCTGATVRRLPLGDGLQGVCYLRTLDDALAIRQRLAGVRRAVVIGGGYVGLEAAATLARQGVHVTLLERGERVLNRVAGPLLSEYIAALHQHHGVDLVCNADVVAINGRGQVESVSCADGQQFAADLVIIGVGIVPNTRLAQDAGLRIENGIWVDEFCRTSHPDVYAAGDCTSHPSALYGRQVRLESVQNANDQTRVAALNISGANEVYNVMPWFWSDQFDIKLQTAGLSAEADDVTVAGSLAADSDGFVIRYYQHGRLIAGDCVNRPRDFMALRKELAGQIAGN